MSFTNDVKRELCGCDTPEELKDTLRYGMMFGFKGNDPYFLTRDKTVAGYVKRSFPKNSMELRQEKSGNIVNWFVTPADAFTSVKYRNEGELAYDVIGADDAAIGVFLRGAFITCGNIYVQKAGYHFELSTGSSSRSESLCRIINEQGMTVNISHRGDSYFLYSKNSENISDILTFMGAVQSAMEIMNIKIIKEVRSNINRSVNCETANIDRTAKAAAKQLDDIRLLLEDENADKLPEELKEIARLRLENPDMSLRDLGALIDPPISRSGVNHRFERIALLADELRKHNCS